MSYLKFILLILPITLLCQTSDYTLFEAKNGELKIPGEWLRLNTTEDSGQTYFINRDEVIIALAKNPQRSYPFYKKEVVGFEAVKAFYKWDSDHIKSQNIKTKKIKENPEMGYIIWKYHDGTSDNIFLFGTSSDYFLNLLIYSTVWKEKDKISFLEDLYKLNK